MSITTDPDPKETGLSYLCRTYDLEVDKPRTTWHPLGPNQAWHAEIDGEDGPYVAFQPSGSETPTIERALELDSQTPHKLRVQDTRKYSIRTPTQVRSFEPHGTLVFITDEKVNVHYEERIPKNLTQISSTAPPATCDDSTAPPAISDRSIATNVTRDGSLDQPVPLGSAAANISLPSSNVPDLVTEMERKRGRQKGKGRKFF